MWQNDITKKMNNILTINTIVLFYLTFEATGNILDVGFLGFDATNYLSAIGLNYLILILPGAVASITILSHRFTILKMKDVRSYINHINMTIVVTIIASIFISQLMIITIPALLYIVGNRKNMEDMNNEVKENNNEVKKDNKEELIKQSHEVIDKVKLKANKIKENPKFQNNYKKVLIIMLSFISALVIISTLTNHYELTKNDKYYDDLALFNEKFNKDYDVKEEAKEEAIMNSSYMAEEFVKQLPFKQKLKANDVVINNVQHMHSYRNGMDYISFDLENKNINLGLPIGYLIEEFGIVPKQEGSSWVYTEEILKEDQFDATKYYDYDTVLNKGDKKRFYLYIPELEVGKEYRVVLRLTGKSYDSVEYTSEYFVAKK